MKRCLGLLVLAPVLLFAACSRTSETKTTAQKAPDGASIFSANCSTCHGSNGSGVPGAFPPLAGNPLVTGDPNALIHIVRNGLSGAILIKGQKYNGLMPAWNATLSNDQMAAVITYVRSSWGNNGSSVTAAQVAAAK